MQGLWSWNQYLKVSNYIKTCSTGFPGAQCLTPPWIPLEGNWRSATAAGQGSVSREADDNCCCCSVSGKCSWQAPIYSWQLRCGFEEKHTPECGPSLKVRATPGLSVLILLLFTLCDLVDGSTPGSSVLCHLPEFVQIHIHQVGDAIQPSHPLLPL